jgi:hypothetical protein
VAESRLVRAELARHDWSRLRCGCGGTAGHVPEIFEGILSAETPDDVFGMTLEGHLEVDGAIFEVALSAVSVILASLAGPLPDFAFDQLMAMLWCIAEGQPHPSEVELGYTSLGDECRFKMREGSILLLHYAVDRRDSTAGEILDLIGEDGNLGTYYSSNLTGTVGWGASSA